MFRPQSEQMGPVAVERSNPSCQAFRPDTHEQIIQSLADQFTRPDDADGAARVNKRVVGTTNFHQRHDLCPCEDVVRLMRHLWTMERRMRIGERGSKQGGLKIPPALLARVKSCC